VKNRLVVVPSIKEPVRPSPGFAKKDLATYKIDIAALCGFGCRYCSSNTGNYLRINRERFADLTEQQLGERVYPSTDPSLMMVWSDIIERLERQLAKKPRTWGAGETLVFSMLTDGFSPALVQQGTTEAALRLLLERTSFRIRILTKNAIVGSDKWIEFFKEHPGRVVVGLSVGTLDDEWARRIEISTSSPSSRLRALANLQRAGIPTYGMLCPIFPDVLLMRDGVEQLVERINPAAVETIWAEPFNDRVNWRAVRDGYAPGSSGYAWFTAVYERGERREWSRYASDLYTKLRRKGESEGWLSKLKYLLYEHDISADDASAFAGLEGVLLQSPQSEGGMSRNHAFAAHQSKVR
jgi:DNA repair photolyase